jgi:hypothetical protein
MSTMTCGYCGKSFAEDQGQPACASCPLRSGCRFLRCPHCGYENPTAPPWLARVRGWFTDELGATGETATESEKEALHR